MSKIKMKLEIILLILVLPFILVSQPGEVLRVKAVGKSSQDIKQGSTARAMALRAATLEGYREIAEKAGLAKIARTGDREYKWARFFLKGTKIVSKEYITDHEVEIVMEIPISQLEETAAEIKAYAAEKKRTQLKKEIAAIENKINILKTQLDELKKKLEKIE